MPKKNNDFVKMDRNLNKILIDAANYYKAKVVNSLGDTLISVVLYGSVARNACSKNSDLDILVIAEHLPKRRRERRQKLYPARKETEEKLIRQGITNYLSIIIKERREAANHSPLYLDMVEDAIILYDKNNFFSNILNEIKNKMKQLKSKRVYIDGGWYWDLKPDYIYGDKIEI